MLGARPRRVGPAARRRGHHRGQPGLGDARSRWQRWPTPGSPASRSACSRAVPHVLASPRPHAHAPSACPHAVALGARRRAGRVSLDLIYGTPGESLDDWRASVEAALSRPASTTSARTRSSSRTAPGWPCRCAAARSPELDGDDQADQVLLADELFAAAGLRWYEVSNWARTPGRRVPPQPRLLARRRLVGHRPRRALARRRGALVERQAPAAYADRARPRAVPGGRAARRPTPRRAPRARHAASALAEGLHRAPAPGRAARPWPGSSPTGWWTAAAFAGRVVLTLKGRLLADAVVRRLLDF